MKRFHIALVAGEASGDLLAADLMRALRAQYPQLRFTGVGGAAMKEAGLEALFDSQRLAVMGLVEVVKHLPDLYRAKNEILQFYQQDKPDVFIGIDAPDFNVRLEQALHQRGIPTVHYVSPSLWAWKEHRIHAIKRCVDLMLCLFPFETDIYQRHGVKALCVGHSMRERLPYTDRAAARSALNLPSEPPMLALCVGSRASEVKRLLPHFLAAYMFFKHHHPDWHGVLSLNHEVDAHGQACIAKQDDLHVVRGQSAYLLQACDLALLKSGTITLEAAFLGVPQVMAYRVHPLTAWLAKRLLNIHRFALPNLLLNQDVVPECVQDDCHGGELARQCSRLAEQPELRQAQIQHYQTIKALLPERSSEVAAQAVLQLLSAS